MIQTNTIKYYKYSIDENICYFDHTLISETSQFPYRIGCQQYYKYRILEKKTQSIMRRVLPNVELYYCITTATYNFSMLPLLLS